MLLKQQHRYVIEMVAEYLDVELEVILHGVIDYASHIEILDSFFAEGGRRAVLFYYQDGSPPEMGNSLI